MGVVTSLGDAHLGGFGSKEQIFTAKSELLEFLSENGKVFLPGDDPQMRMLAQKAKCSVVFVGEGEQNEIRATEIEQRNGQLLFQVDGTQFCVNVAGRHQLNSALIAVALGREFGMDAAAIAAGLESFEPVAGRCRLEEIGPWTVIDDTYNASPSSMQAACELLKNYEGANKKILVTGDMLELGDEAQQLHRQIGAWAWDAGVEDWLVLGEHRHDVADGAIAAGFSGSQVAKFDRFSDLLAELEGRIEPGDVVLAKGSRALKMERVVDWLRKRSLQSGLCNLQANQSENVA
jgi:UDP-N-acetylmuramoyl-tripeptide--D-alanyl-D-alanine ligase